MLTMLKLFGIKWASARASLKSLDYTVPRCSKCLKGPLFGFRRFPRDARLSDSCSPDRCSFSFCPLATAGLQKPTQAFVQCRWKVLFVKTTGPVTIKDMQTPPHQCVKNLYIFTYKMRNVLERTQTSCAMTVKSFPETTPNISAVTVKSFSY